MDEPPQRRKQGFDWRETATRMRALLAQHPLAIDDHRRAFFGRDPTGASVRLVPPPVAPILPEHGSAWDYVDWFESRDAALGRHAVVLLQAGAASLGVWEDDDLVAHKSTKKYVVRGRGKAQPTHLKTRGKSAYGSRLRLQNARRLLVEVNARMREWRDAFGTFDRVYYSCPVRLWATLMQTRPAPPFAPAAATRIPLDVAVPTFAELRRVRGWMTRGAIETADPNDR